ncbi:hypothetical protein AAIH22_34135, partial [Pseudomonas aeruginosa]
VDRFGRAPVALISGVVGGVAMASIPLLDAWAGATAASSVIATIIGAWVGGGLVDRFGRAPVALISGVVGGVAMASIPLLDAVGALSNTGLIACV